MTYYVGLDVSVKATSICVLAIGGQVVAHGSVAREPMVLARTSHPSPDFSP